MRKETRKEFVVCKDYAHDNGLVVTKGCIVLIHPIEFFDGINDSSYRRFLLDNNEDPADYVDVMFLTLHNYIKLQKGGEWREEASFPVSIYDLPYVFNDLKIQPRNITVEFDD